MNNLVRIILICLLLTGCETVKVHWVPVVTQDEFTDEVTKMVTVGSFYTKNDTYTYTARYYPFVGEYENEIIFGVRSGGRIRIPVGDIQIRIDDNPAWTIRTTETPIIMGPSRVDPEEERALSATEPSMDAFYNVAMEQMKQITSPFTATGGIKAKKIIREMLNGKKIIYRSIGMNQAGSTTGEYLIDESFKSALIKADISIDEILTD